MERVLAEISVRIKARHSLPDWVSAAGHILQLLVRLDVYEYLADLQLGEMGRLFRSLSSIAAAQMELGPEPAVPRRSLTNVWIFGYNLLKRRSDEIINQSSELVDRKISTESNVSSEASDVNDAHEMKNLRFFPEIGSSLPHIQLLITAHHELGSCYWCSDGQQSLLRAHVIMRSSYKIT